MDFIERYLPYKILLFLTAFLCVTNVLTICSFLNKNEQEPCFCEECETVKNEDASEVAQTEKIKVDIKGYVKKPGVYELEQGTIINDLIKLAGGLKTNGTTANINLSKKLNNEDMIIVLSKSELKKQTSTSTSAVSTNTTTASTETKNQNTTSSSTSSTTEIEPTNKKISLNTATKEELMTLNGIGEAKALSIIAYRSQTPFKEITEIMNISGIGESIYEKIKDHITI